MATRKKKVEADESAARGFTVVVEEMRGHFKVFGEQLGATRDDVAVIKGDVAALRGDVVALKGDFAELKGDVTALNLRFERVEHEVGLLKIAVIEQGRELRNELKKKVDRDEVEAIVERVVARSGRR